MKKIIAVAVVAVFALSGCTVEFSTDGLPPDEPQAEYTPDYSEPDPVEPTGTMEDATNTAADEAVAVMQDWDSSFRRPPIVFYDDELTVDGETFDPDTAAWYDGKIYIDPDTYYGSTTDGNFHYTIAHELGHGWEEHYDPSYPVGKSSELYADCIAGAIGAEVGWDTDAMVDYARYDLAEDDIHGDGEDRYDAMTTGATGGHEACTH